MLKKLVAVLFQLRAKNAEPLVVHEINNGYLLGHSYYATELELLNALVEQTAERCEFKGSYAVYDRDTDTIDFRTGAMEEAETFSTPVTVVMGGEEIEGTANFKVTRTAVPLEDYEGDVVEVSAVAEADETPALDIEPTAKARACGNCGEAGHNRRGCPHPAAPRAAKYKTKDIGQTPGLVTKDKEPEADWYFNDILDMLRDGMTEQEVYEKVYMSITNAQFREAMEWAKEHLD